MRLIDAHGLDILGYLEEFPECESDKAWNAAVREICAYVDLTPTIDAVPVVRCKDCEWYEPCTDWGFDEATGRRDHSKIIKLPYGECHGQNFSFTEDGCLRVGEGDFCSYGERKDGDGNG